jgi:serine/threonine protein kinase
MTYCPGGDLSRYIMSQAREGQRLEEHWLLFVLAKQTCDVLSFLHGRDSPVVHRDLKPENVLVSTDRKSIMLTDFGLAHQMDQTYMSTRAGSLHYVSPECWKKHYSSAVDMWALGCILYAAATARVTVTTARVMFNDARERGFQRDLRRDLEMFSPNFCNFVLACLQVEPERRITASAGLAWLTDAQIGKFTSLSTATPKKPRVALTTGSGVVSRDSLSSPT